MEAIKQIVRVSKNHEIKIRLPNKKGMSSE